MRILRKRVLLGRDRIVLAHDAGDRLGLGHLALFDELLAGAETAATGGLLEEPGLVAPLVTLYAAGQRLQHAAPVDFGVERVDRHARSAYLPLRKGCFSKFISALVSYFLQNYLF